jgi:hypothetical protein
MDQFSYRVANLLVGNSADAAVLEVTLQGLVVEALTPVMVAITGGDLNTQVNNRRDSLHSEQSGFHTSRSGPALRSTRSSTPRCSGCCGSHPARFGDSFASEGIVARRADTSLRPTLETSAVSAGRHYDALRFPRSDP